MAELLSYKTLMKRDASEFVVKKSRFIGYGAPCESERDALAFLDEIRKKHKDASHNCFAYIIGPNMGIMRYSDDGEPGGTAGLPIIETVKSRGVTNACVVVTRYFGGILLGAGGLARAYAQGAQAALSACGVGEMHKSVQYVADIPYPLFGRVERALETLPVADVQKTFADAVTLSYFVRCVDENEVAAALVALTDGKCEPVRFDESFRAWALGEKD